MISFYTSVGGGRGYKPAITLPRFYRCRGARKNIVSAGCGSPTAEKRTFCVPFRPCVNSLFTRHCGAFCPYADEPTLQLFCYIIRGRAIFVRHSPAVLSVMRWEVMRWEGLPLRRTDLRDGWIHRGYAAPASLRFRGIPCQGLPEPCSEAARRPLRW